MAVETRRFNVLIAAGTPIATPQLTLLTFPARSVDKITARIPAGPSGFAGFRLAMAGTQIIPWNVGTWVVADDQVIEWLIADLPTSGAWQMYGYNTGTYDHTIYLEFALSTIQAATVAQLPPPIDNADLSGSAGLPN